MQISAEKGIREGEENELLLICSSAHLRLMPIYARDRERGCCDSLGEEKPLSCFYLPSASVNLLGDPARRFVSAALALARL
jgi:hypothetical protein